MTRARRARIGPLMSVVVFAAVLAGCANQRMSVSATDEASTALLLQSLYTSTVGTAADREAVAVLEFDALHRPITECMARAGFDSPMPRHDNEYPGVTELHPDFVDAVVPVDSTFVDQEGLGRSVAVSRTLAAGQTGEPDASNPSYAGLSGPQQTAFNEQMGKCTPDSSSYVGKGEPTLSRTLSGELIALVKATLKSDNASVSLANNYGDCMANAGFGVASRNDLIEGIYAEYAKIQGSQSLKEASGTNEWADEVAREHAAASADATCRADMHNEAMAVLAAPLKDFQSQHAAEIASLSDQWAKVRSEAAAAQAAWANLR